MLQYIRVERKERQEIERPGETFQIAKGQVLPRLVLGLSVGILILNVKQMGWWGLAFAPLYLGLHQGFTWLLRYTNHGSRAIAHPMNAAVFLMLVCLSLTFFGQMAVEGTYSRRQQIDAEYAAELAAFHAEQADYDRWVEKREAAAERRADAKIRTEDIRRQAAASAERQANSLLALVRETGRPVRGVKLSLPQGADVTKEEVPAGASDRKAPVRPIGPKETAIQFYGRWLFKLKLAQFGDLGVMLGAFCWLLFASTIVNHKSRQKLVSDTDQTLVAMVMTDRETLANIPEWREPLFPPPPVEPVLSQNQAEAVIEQDREEQPTTTHHEEKTMVVSLPDHGGSAEIEVGETPSLPETEEPISSDSESVTAQPIEVIDYRESETDIRAEEAEKVAEITHHGHHDAEIMVGDRGGLAEIEPTTETEKPTTIFLICDGQYKLRLRADGGFDLWKVKPKKGEKRDIGYIKKALGRQILDSESAEQWNLVEPILIKKGIIPAMSVPEIAPAEVIEMKTWAVAAR